jgi:outer membrane receptor protein involved in Fe transport
MRSNRFVYTEWVNAVYAQYRVSLKKLSYQLGLRVEHTNSEGDLTALTSGSDKNVSRKYIDFFPNAGITWQVNKSNSLGLSFSRRIDRPKYLELNPFETKLDELSYQKGNPFLNPQYTRIIELRYAWKYKLVTTLSYSDVRDFIAQITDTTEGKRTYLTQRNLASQKLLGLNISYPFSITRWWNVYASLNIYYTRYRASFEAGNNINIDITVGNLYQQQTFTLGKGWTAELSGFYNTPGVWSGTFKTGTMANLDAGLQKKCWHDNATIKASVSDIFFTMKWKNESTLSGSNIHANGNWESRQFKLNFTYYFGNKQVKNARDRNTGLDDLNKRAN